MNFLRGANTTGQCLGVEFAESGLYLALCSPSKSGETIAQPYEARLLAALNLADEKADPAIALKDWVGQHQLKGVPCNVSLSPGSYQLLLTEAPDVPQEELRDAIRWKIKELSSIPVERAAIDVFLLPNDGARSSKSMAYVVVSELSQVNRIIETITNAELSLRAIDISELALRNLSLLKQEGQLQGRGLGLVQIYAGRATVYLYREGNLYLSRQFNLDYGGGLLDEIPEDSFLLEVQRSLDYYERQMRQTPPVNLFIFGENISQDKINTNISRGLSVPAKYLGLEDMFRVADETLDPPILQQCSVALGAALREQVPNL